MIIETKYNKIEQFDKDLFVPINDTTSFEFFKKNNWIYNRLYLAQLQNLDCSVMPIIPKNYPIILKPIINLYGMSKDVYKINNQIIFNRYSTNQGFWCQYLEGIHKSIDIIVIDNKIIWYCCFIGHKLDIIGAFDYWELDWNNLSEKLLTNLKMIINKLDNYSGIINFECIGDNIIEAHLRGGDIFLLNDNVIKEIVNLYRYNKWQLKNYENEKMFIVPIWKQYMKNPNQDLEQYFKDKQLDYSIDGDGLAGPPLFNRKAIIVNNNLDYLLQVRNNLYKIE